MEIRILSILSNTSSIKSSIKFFSEIQRIRTTPPLFRAYEQVYNNLEDNLCPQFHTSDEVSTAC